MSEHPENSVPAEPPKDEAAPAPAKVSIRSAAQTERAKRLAGALRENLRRRKALKPSTRPNGN